MRFVDAFTFPAKQFEEWLALYITAHWKLTACNIATHEQSPSQLNLPPVRMTFMTDRPFYPYKSDPSPSGLPEL
ncbi:MAG TPA: hypothetical protein VKU00_11445 [Chthonomonadaceae bacterium]|nr:hypothetical protein [Chthonomonadaceae bacterium]